MGPLKTADVLQPSEDLREIRRLQPLLHASTARASHLRPGSRGYEAAGNELNAVLAEIAAVQERVYGRHPVGWIDIVERAELAVMWCSDNYQASGIRDLGQNAEPDHRAMSQLVDAVLAVAEGRSR